VAQAWHQLGRLRAGPLEDLDGAIDAYQRALEADPELQAAEEALADLLVHRPKQWREALHRHQHLLQRNPFRLASLRGLVRIAEQRGNTEGGAAGRALLRGLGTATPEERIAAPGRPQNLDSGLSSLADPVWEVARQIAREASREIGEALGVGPPGEVAEPAGHPLARFRAKVVEEEGALAAPPLVPLPAQELGEALTLVAQLALGAPAVQGSGELVNALSRSLGRRTRRRLRKVLGRVDAAQIEAIDWSAWRAELRGLACARCLAAVDGDLRTAFLALTPGAAPESGGMPPPESDLRDAVAASPEATALLRELTRGWIASLA